MKRSAVTLGLIRFGGLGLALLMNVVAARLLGPVGFGTLAFLLSLVTLMSAASSGGLTSLLTRDVASAVPLGESIPPASAAFSWVVITSFVLSLVFLGIVALGQLPAVSMGYALLAVLGALLGLGVLSVLSGIWRGLGSPAAGDMPVAVLIPAMFLVLVLLTTSVVRELSVMLFLAAYVAAIWLAAFGSMIFLHSRGTSVGLLLHRLGQPLSRAWLHGFWPFLSLAVVGALTTQLGTLMVGWVADETSTAFYRVAERMAMLVSLPLLVLNAVIASQVVRSHTVGDTETLVTLVRRARRLALAGAVPFGMVMILFGEDLVAAIFGVQYLAAAQGPLIILVLGQWINVACGSVGLVLSMCGHEKTVLREQALAVGVSFVLLPPAIIFAGVNGAAVVMAASLALWNLRLVGVMRRQVLSAARIR